MIDFIAGGLDLAGIFTVGNKDRRGFLLHLIGNAAWVYVAMDLKVYGLLLVVLPAMVLNIRNFLKWKKSDSMQSAS